ncbi:MAG: HAD family hydrolase [Clostridia bacterium]|nr:HAD family hydrolase [Clostridia bacterium]
MRVQAIVTDLDRTLLRTDKSISGYTLRVWEKCRKRGIKLFAASARPIRDVLEFGRKVHFDGVAATNGAVVAFEGEKLECGMGRAECEAVLEKLAELGDVFISLETDVGLFSNRDIPQWKPTVYGCFPKLPEGVLPYKIIASSDNPVLYADPGRFLTEGVYHTVADGKLLQVMSQNATKWKGVEQMLSRYGIPPENTVYFGDDNDDIEPIKNCGLGVAVANAIPEVLSVADRVAPSNDSDGVALFLEGLIGQATV